MKTPNEYRVRSGILGSDDSFGNNGMFMIPHYSYTLKVMASDGMGWEHVSVSLPNRNPNWDEMCFIKDLFWDDIETVIQYHPPKRRYINNHEHCLHLWKPIGKNIETPPKILVGIKELNLEGGE